MQCFPLGVLQYICWYFCTLVTGSLEHQASLGTGPHWVLPSHIPLLPSAMLESTQGHTGTTWRHGRGSGHRSAGAVFWNMHIHHMPCCFISTSWWILKSLKKEQLRRIEVSLVGSNQPAPAQALQPALSNGNAGCASSVDTSYRCHASRTMGLNTHDMDTTHVRAQVDE
jgi:hypothetical protein